MGLGTERELMIKLQEKDEAAFAQLYRLHARRVYAYARNVLKSPALAEDVVQDTFVKLWETAAFIQPDRPLLPYLFTIARNHSLNLLRRGARETWITDEMAAFVLDKAEDALAYTQRKQTDQLLQDAISRLPEQRRLVYELCHHDGYSYKEAAEKLGIKDATVNSQMVKALKFIRSFIVRSGALLLFLF